MCGYIEICADITLDKLYSEILNVYELKIDSICVEKRLLSKGKKYVLFVKFQKPAKTEPLAEIIYSWIRKIYEPHLMKIALSNDFEDNSIDFKKILLDAQKRMNFINIKHKYIVKKITNYFKTENQLSVEGFIRFRLKEYRSALHISLCDAVEEFYIEQEYNDFIRLLREYISSKPSMIDLIHIRPENDGFFSFFDFTKTKIRIDVEKYNDCNQIENFLTKDDILISILIALNPKRIIWHNTEYFNNENLFNTIKLIFANRFSVCSGCELCDKE